MMFVSSLVTSQSHDIIYHTLNEVPEGYTCCSVPRILSSICLSLRTFISHISISSFSSSIISSCSHISFPIPNGFLPSSPSYPSSLLSYPDLLNKSGFTSSWNFFGESGLVNTSAQLSLDLTCSNANTPDACAFLTAWYAMLLCFFFSIDDGKVVFSMTELLSPNILHGPSTSTPSILSEYRYSIASSVAILAATNSDPYELVSTVFCLFETYLTNVWLTNTIIPVTDLRVTVSCA